MARPKKFTLDFFVHDVNARNDRKVRSLRRKHGNDGYATYFCLLEMLCSEDGIKLSLSNSLDLETAVEECGLRDEAHFYKVVQTCVDIGLFDKQLWEGDRLIFSHGLHDRYMKRLEDRKQAAIRKERQVDARKLQKRIDEIEGNGCQGEIPGDEVIALDKKVVTRDNSSGTRDNSPELQNYRTTELSELQNSEIRTSELIDRVTSKNTAASFDAIAHTPQTIDVLVESSEPVSAAPSPRTSTEQTHSVQPALSERASVPPAPKNSKKRKIKHIPEQAPEAFQMFWDTYYAFCLDVSCSAGARAAAVQEWDALLPAIERSDLEEGTAYYLQKKREQFVTKGEAIGVSHCCRFLRDLKWQEALDHKRRGDIQPVMTPGNRRAIQTYQSVMTAIKDL